MGDAPGRKKSERIRRGTYIKTYLDLTLPLPLRQFYTTGQAAAICGVAPRTVTKWADSGRISGCYKIPLSNDRRISLIGLADFLSRAGVPVPDVLKSGGVLACGLDKQHCPKEVGYCSNQCELGEKIAHGFWDSVILGDQFGLSQTKMMAEYCRSRMWKTTPLIAVVDPSNSVEQVKYDCPVLTHVLHHPVEWDKVFKKQYVLGHTLVINGGFDLDASGTSDRQEQQSVRDPQEPTATERVVPERGDHDYLSDDGRTGSPDTHHVDGM